MSPLGLVKYGLVGTMIPKTSLIGGHESLIPPGERGPALSTEAPTFAVFLYEEGPVYLLTIPL